ncbi:uncharacterized protein [Watersipora subatra]|uniref:uncharacterized protein n=1 Tax=Watersipora subatra TaxID=2589382 RepID=UPI00355B8BCA
MAANIMNWLTFSLLLLIHLTTANIEQKFRRSSQNNDAIVGRLEVDASSLLAILLPEVSYQGTATVEIDIHKGDISIKQPEKTDQSGGSVVEERSFFGNADIEDHLPSVQRRELTTPTASRSESLRELLHSLQETLSDV